MYTHKGTLVYQTHDEDGLIEVIDYLGERALHFGSDARQSSMLIGEPDRLHSRYAKAMMAALLFHPQPEQILMIGLGGGTITKFLLHQFAACRIKVVEFRRSVLKVARSHFSLPLSDRLKVKIGCGAQHVLTQSREQAALYDFMVIDAYHHDGMAPEISNALFFDNCHTLLKPDGVLVINLWKTDEAQFEAVSWNLQRSFDERVVFLPVKNRGNIIAIALGADKPRFALKKLIEQAQYLESLYQLEFPVYLHEIRRHNNQNLHRVFKS